MIPVQQPHSIKEKQSRPTSTTNSNGNGNIFRATALLLRLGSRYAANWKRDLPPISFGCRILVYHGTVPVVSDVLQFVLPQTNPNGPTSPCPRSGPTWLRCLYFLVHLFLVVQFVRPESHKYRFLQCFDRFASQHWSSTRQE